MSMLNSETVLAKYSGKRVLVTGGAGCIAWSWGGEGYCAGRPLGSLRVEYPYRPKSCLPRERPDSVLMSMRMDRVNSPR